MDRLELACSVWFQHINYIGARTMFHLRETFGSMFLAYDGQESKLRAVLNAKQYTAFKAAKYATDPMNYLERVEKQGIRYVSFFEDVFPDKLKHIPDPPFGLFVKGKLPDAGRPSVAIIGARACSEYGKMVAREFAAKLAACDVQIISGMARGIDSISQETCLRTGGRTFAVLGSGVDVCYPGELENLYADIPKNGGLISTYAPGTPPAAVNFPPRNRIISGLADVVLVVEARKKSGTLITVDMALEQGREVGIIPGRITDSLSQGCHELIKQGAAVIVDVEQLLELLNSTFILQASSLKDTWSGYKKDRTGIDFNSRQDITEYMKYILQVLEEDPAEPMEPEKIYARLHARGNAENFQTLLETLVDLELMNLCKSNKNHFSIC